MDLLNLGQQARKTGLRAPTNVRRDEHDMEDINEFFADDDDDLNSSKSSLPKQTLRSKETTFAKSKKRADFNNVARKIDFNETEADSFILSPITIGSKVGKRNKKSPLRSPLPEYPDTYEQDLDVDLSLSPVEVPNLSPVPKSAAFTRKMATGKTKNVSKPGRKKRPPTINSVESESPATPIVEGDSSNNTKTKGTNKGNVRKPSNSNGPRAARKDNQTPDTRKITPKITRPSPLPSPPPDGLRRSKRTKIAPLAFWRNERIVYAKADDEDYDEHNTTLASDIRNIPLQEIKEVVHMPEKSTQIVKKGPGRPRGSVTKNRKSPPSDYDYQSDPDIEGSEWYKNKSLELEVFSEPRSDKKTTRKIAWAPNGGNFRVPENDDASKIENFKVASLFNEDQSFTASGLIELPAEGVKSLRNTGNFVFVFHVVKGLVEVTINDSTFVVTRGCSFEVPRGNYYGLKNIGAGTSRLFFVQVSGGHDNGSDGEWD